MSIESECYRRYTSQYKFRKYSYFVHKVYLEFCVNQNITHTMFLNLITDNTLVLVSSLSIDKMSFLWSKMLYRSFRGLWFFTLWQCNHGYTIITQHFCVATNVCLSHEHELTNYWGHRQYWYSMVGVWDKMAQGHKSCLLHSHSHIVSILKLERIMPFVLHETTTTIDGV